MATKPLVDVFNGLGNLLLRPFGILPAREVGHAPHSEGDWSCSRRAVPTG